MEETDDKILLTNSYLREKLKYSNDHCILLAYCSSLNLNDILNFHYTEITFSLSIRLTLSLN